MQTQLWVGKEKPAPEKFIPARNAVLWCKPEPGTGLWTSTYRPMERYDGTMGSSWVEFAFEEGLYHEEVPFHYWLLEVDPAARVYTIDSLVDLQALLEEASLSAGDYGFPKMLRLSRWPNFEKLSETYDGIHLTDQGQWATRLSDPNLYGWDIESTVWLRWSFTSITSDGVYYPPKTK